ncbi:UDP-N-acetylglucosamine--LPS N-acetylglucosamine transferase [Bradyrhizobium sp. GCM10028915]|uniref:UDP-N-acetylglucosamine--LPS N-acetylglucosamine transferase n=1 Tax=Bradyrhizobium sp. GCM10028915 TaxID=3273385 RepID=UPI00360E3E20
MREFTASSALQLRNIIPRGTRHKLLAVSSGGGHWIQLLRVSAAFDNCEVTFVTTHDSYRSQVKDCAFWTVNDSNLSNKLGLLKTAAQLSRIICVEMPDVVISTGAAPGYFALRLARLVGAHTIWLDSIANVEKLSISGARIGRYADLWLTQWPHLARPEGPHYVGSVL